jgi:hypothetical protein
MQLKKSTALFFLVRVMPQVDVGLFFDFNLDVKDFNAVKMHYKNMQTVAQSMYQWVQQHLVQYSIYECEYGRYNLTDGTFLPLPMYYPWFATFMEKNLDLMVAERLAKTGVHRWAEEGELYRIYDHYVRHGYPQVYRYDFVRLLPNGYELLAVGTLKPISYLVQRQLYQAFDFLSKTAIDLKQTYPYLPVELRAHQDVLQLHRQAYVP